MLPGVFAAGHGTLAPFAAELAALLYFGHDVVVSHVSAARIWRLEQALSGTVHVTVIGRNVRSRTGLIVHRVASLDPRDVRLREGIPVTAPARTLIDVAGIRGEDALEGALAEARVQKLITERELRAATARAPGRAGVALLRAVLRLQDSPRMMRSEAEGKLLKLLRDARLPPPETNARVLGYEVDFVWRAQKLVVEVDGYAFHGHRAAFERDRAKDQVLVAAGYRVIRVTWRQLEREPLVVLTKIAQALNAQDPSLNL